MARRKNAEFTRKMLSQTIDDAAQVQDNRRLVNAFYETLNRRFPGNAVVHIPPPEEIHPKTSELDQLFVFGDYAVRKIAPIAMDAAGLNAEAAKLRKLPAVVDFKSAEAVHSAAGKYIGAYDPYDPVYDVGYPAVESAVDALGVVAHRVRYRWRDDIKAARKAADAAAEAAKLNPEATWDAVTDMLRAL